MSVALYNQLQKYQNQVLQFCRDNPELYNVQFHPDLSPLGWHLGHCVYTEGYWIREVFLEDASCRDDGCEIYNPLLMEKSKRSAALPEYETMCTWAAQHQQQNLCMLKTNRDHKDMRDLMDNDFLLHFLVQHYAQHLETMQMVLSQALLQHNEHTGLHPLLKSNPVIPETCELGAGQFRIGRMDERLPYDNEYPAHEVTINTCHIMKRTVNNAEYLRFVESGGYQQSSYWSAQGWQWRQQNNITHPAHWQPCENGSWHVFSNGNTQSNADLEPVYGISYHEASAFAGWAGGRLAHEYEWEIASLEGLLQDTGIVWEWCRNTFFPYKGFTPFPYEGYSMPYYDGNHYTLKGGSYYTRPEIKRPTFRNYYQPDKNFLFAGIRLVFDEVT